MTKTIIIPDLEKQFNINGVNKVNDIIDKIENEADNDINRIISKDMVDILNFYDEYGNKLDNNDDISTTSKIYIKLNADNYYIDDIGGMKTTNRKYIGNTKNFKNNYLTSQKRFEDAEMLLKSQKLQLILMSMVGGISILCLLLILRKFSKKQ